MIQPVVATPAGAAGEPRAGAPAALFHRSRLKICPCPTSEAHGDRGSGLTPLGGMSSRVDLYPAVDLALVVGDHVDLITVWRARPAPMIVVLEVADAARGHGLGGTGKDRLATFSVWD